MGSCPVLRVVQCLATWCEGCFSSICLWKFVNGGWWWWAKFHTHRRWFVRSHVQIGPVEKSKMWKFTDRQTDGRQATKTFCSGELKTGTCIGTSSKYHLLPCIVISNMTTPYKYRDSDFQNCRPKHHWRDISYRNAHLVHQNWYPYEFYMIVEPLEWSIVYRVQSPAMIQQSPSLLSLRTPPLDIKGG
jgi:hypothetical protein